MISVFCSSLLRKAAIDYQLIIKDSPQAINESTPTILLSGTISSRIFFVTGLKFQ